MQTNIATVSGSYFDYVDLDSNRVSLGDIATGLGNECRYAGQVHDHYSVAQHSVLVSKLLQIEFDNMGQETLLYGLFHDASEAFCKDIPTPLKKLLPGYYEIEARVQDWLCSQFRINPADVDMQAVQTADLMALRIEKERFGNLDNWAALQGIPAASKVQWHLDPVAPRAARKMWLDEWFFLRAQGRMSYWDCLEGVTC